MSGEETAQWSQQLRQAIAHAAAAHGSFPNTLRDAVRFHDQKTPYVVHPLWCASSLLMEPVLPEDLRRDGAVALLWHDTLEDTSMPLPPWSP
jgi:(p)ppGpp synthase/HD superfamily hydrolase